MPKDNGTDNIGAFDEINISQQQKNKGVSLNDDETRKVAVKNESKFVGHN